MNKYIILYTKHLKSLYYIYLLLNLIGFFIMLAHNFSNKNHNLFLVFFYFIIVYFISITLNIMFVINLFFINIFLFFLFLITISLIFNNIKFVLNNFTY